eukprot:gene15516-18733_t
MLMAVPTIVIVAVAVFTLIRLIPGDPAALMLGDLAEPQQIAALRSTLGLDQSIPVQFMIWVGHLFNGDFGKSIVTGEPVLLLVLSRFFISAQIVVLAVLIASVIAVPAGVIAAWKQNSLTDLALVGTATLTFNGVIGGTIITLLFIVAAIGMLWTPFDPMKLSFSASDRTLRRLRGGEIGVVFQEPMTSLNPSMTIGRQLEEGLILHTKQTPEMRRTNILHMLTRVGLNDPHPYTRKLLSSLPFRGDVRAIDTSVSPIVSARDIVVDYAGRKSLFKKGIAKRALHGISIDIHPGEVVALVGGSGSGKTTLGRTIAGLVKETSGEILFHGKRRDNDWFNYRMNCQMVFQDPYSSLDPRMTIMALVEEALRLIPDLTAAEKKQRAAETLEEVGLGK